MLTEKQEKDLDLILKTFIEKQYTSYTSGTERVYLLYDEDEDEFFTGEESYYGYVYILDKPIEENARYYTEDYTSYFEELKEEASAIYEKLRDNGTIDPYISPENED